VFFAVSGKGYRQLSSWAEDDDNNNLRRDGSQHDFSGSSFSIGSNKRCQHEEEGKDKRKSSNSYLSSRFFGQHSNKGDGNRHKEQQHSSIEDMDDMSDSGNSLNQIFNQPNLTFDGHKPLTQFFLLITAVH